MTESKTDQAADGDAGEASWRDRALERSLRTARAKAMSRSDKFIQTAQELLQETGRSDFTVQELVDRSRTSLRSFYQYFSGKDELLLALLEESIAKSADLWRAEIEGKDALESLKVVVTSIYAGSSVTGDLNRGLAPYHASLAESHAEDYTRAISPMTRLMHELTEQGIREGAFRTDVKPEQLIRVFMQSVIGATLFTSINKQGRNTAQATEAMWEFCRAGLIGADAPAKARKRK